MIDNQINKIEINTWREGSSEYENDVFIYEINPVEINDIENLIKKLNGFLLKDNILNPNFFFKTKWKVATNKGN